MMLACWFLWTIAQEAPDRDRVRRTTEKILSSEEYDSSGEEKQEKEASRRRCSSESGKEGAGVPMVSAPVVEGLLYVLCAVGCGLVLAFAIRAIVRLRRGAKSTKEEAGKKAPSEPDVPEALLSMADEEAGREQFLEAIRLCHRAALLGLDRRRVVRFHESYTNGDYRRQLRARETDRPPFESLAGIFERVYFGRFPAAGTDFRECRRAADSLIREATA